MCAVQFNRTCAKNILMRHYAKHLIPDKGLNIPAFLSYHSSN